MWCVFFSRLEFVLFFTACSFRNWSHLIEKFHFDIFVTFIHHVQRSSIHRVRKITIQIDLRFEITIQCDFKNRTTGKISLLSSFEPEYILRPHNQMNIHPFLKIKL